MNYFLSRTGGIIGKLQHVPAANYTNSDVPIHFLPAG